MSSNPQYLNTPKFSSETKLAPAEPENTSGAVQTDFWSEGKPHGVKGLVQGTFVPAETSEVYLPYIPKVAEVDYASPQLSDNETEVLLASDSGYTTPIAEALPYKARFPLGSGFIPLNFEEDYWASEASDSQLSESERESSTTSWNSVLDTILEFASLVEGIDEIHAYAKMASTILLLIRKPTLDKGFRTLGQIIQGGPAARGLQKTICDVYSFVNEALRLQPPANSQNDVLLRMSQQLVECAYVIRDTFSVDEEVYARDPKIYTASAHFYNVIKRYKKAFKDFKWEFMKRGDYKTTLITLRALKRAYLSGRAPFAEGCLSGTRIYTLGWLSEWINRYDLDSLPNNPNVLFVLGEAGVGKSAIACSIAKRFQGLGRLASYISSGCSLTGGQQIELLYKAIARQGDASQPLHRMSTLDSRRKRTGQVKKAHFGNIFGPVVVVIDALDECKAGPPRQQLLAYLTKYAGSLPSNFRIVVMSRTDEDVMDAIRKNANAVDTLNLNDHKGEAEKDINQYICNVLKEYEEGEPEYLNYKELTTMADSVFHRAVAACDFIKADLMGGSTLTETVQKLKTLPAVLQSKQLHVLHGHINSVTSVAVSLDGRYIVSGSWDLTLRVWNAETGQYVAEFKGHEKPVKCVAFSPDGNHIVSGSHDRTIQVWDVKTGQIQNTLAKEHTKTVTSVAFSPDGKYIGSGSSDSVVQLWDLTSGKVAYKLGHTSCVTSVTFSSDGNFIASGSWDCTVRIWNVKMELNVHRSLKWHLGRITSVAFSPNGKYIVSGSDDRTVQIWNVETEQVVVKLMGHTDIVTSVAFSPDGKYIISGSHDKTIRIWNVETGQIVDTLAEHTDFVTSVAFFPDGMCIVSGSLDGTVQIWNTEKSQVMSKLSEEHTNISSSVTVCSDSKETTTSIHISDIDHSSLLDLSEYSTHTLLGAQDALEHINAKYEDIKNCFSADMISEYFLVMAGFNEQLIQAHQGYLQEIQFFISGSIKDKQQINLISNVTKHCAPFPFVIFTPSGCVSHQIPEAEWSSHVIKIGEDILEHSASLVIYEHKARCPRLEDGCTSVLHLFGGNKVQTLEGNSTTTNGDDIQLGQGQQGTTSNSNQGQENQSRNKHLGSVQQQGDQVASQEDSASGEELSDTDTKKHEVYFSVGAFICESQSGSSTSLHPTTRLRQLQMDGTFVAERKVIDNRLHSLVNFSRLSCQSLTVHTEEDLKKKMEEPPFSFSQIYFKAAVNSQCQDAHIHQIMPQTTSLVAKESTVTQGSKVGHQVKGDISISTTGIKGSLSGSMTDSSSSTIEKKTYTAGIKQYHEKGKVWWGYMVDDPSERDHGKDIVGVELPQVDYFLPSKSSEKVDHIHVMLNSYWIMRPNDTSKAKLHKKIIKCIPWKFGRSSEKRTGYSTIVQSVKITVPHTLKRLYRFTDEFNFEAFDWDASDKNTPALRKAVNDGDGKLQAHAWCIPNENCKRILETPL